jgi:hypothetical protein
LEFGFKAQVGVDVHDNLFTFLQSQLGRRELADVITYRYHYPEHVTCSTVSNVCACAVGLGRGAVLEQMRWRRETGG